MISAIGREKRCHSDPHPLQKPKLRSLAFVPRPHNNGVLVRHEPNAPSGGPVSDLKIGIFLSPGAPNPKREALLRLIGTLGDDRITTTVEDRNATL